jgi:formamidopyrimidine-DNA glycosylase
MPEYPDITVYIDRICHFACDQALRAVRIASPFLLRNADPPIDSIVGMRLRSLERMGKRIVFVFDDDYFLVLHLMISGRLQWRDADAKIPGKVGLAALDFDNGTLTITEASSKKRASLHLVRGRDALNAFDRGGLEVLEASFEDFRAAMTRENHTLRRALTDPSILSGIGNAYSDEICHRARLSPVLLTEKMSDGELEQLYLATREILTEWAERLLAEAGDGFPKKVTAFHEGMAVHGRYGKPCPVCGTPVQRIRYANNETNYCPECQTGGRLLADRSLSRLLKKDWPRSMDEMDALYER